MTKLELLAILDQYPTNAQVIFNVENDNNVLVLDDIDYLDDDFIPILSSEKPCPKIILHLTEKKTDLERVLEQSCTTACPRFCAGTCPYGYNEKHSCPRVRERLNQTDDK